MAAAFAGADEPVLRDWRRQGTRPLRPLHTGFVTIMSELSEFDQQFPYHPLTLTRELVQRVIGS